ncbi:MAG: hypothetical protein M3R23_06130, partial [Actinomycetota bacterium]|nr:hypothetical protein [Actinomycetota bacterium]
LASCGGGPSEDEKHKAVAAAKIAYAKAKQAGTDFSGGPCIAEHLPALPDWVADVAHDPRQSVDDDPANQCSRAREGDADHFVELNPAGNLIRTQ